MSENSRDLWSDTSPSSRESWATLSFVALILLLTKFSAAIWRSQERSFDCSGLFKPLPDFIYHFDFFHGSLAGLIAGGLLSWRYGFRPALALVLIAQGALLAGSQVPDLRIWGCPLGGLFGLTAGMVFPACFQGMVTVFRPGRQALPLVLLIFLIPLLSMCVWSLYWFYSYEPMAPVIHVWFGLFLISLALAARHKNPAWLKFDLPARPGPPPDFSAWLRTLKIGRLIGFLILSWVCLSIVAALIPLVTYGYTPAGQPGSAFSIEDYQQTAFSMEAGRISLIPVLALICWRGMRLAWAALIVSLLGLAGLVPLLGFHWPIQWIQAPAFGISLFLVLGTYSCYLLLADRVAPGQAGMVVALALLLVELASYLVKELRLALGLPVGPWWPALLSVLALAGALGAAKARIAAKALRWP